MSETDAIDITFSPGKEDDWFSYFESGGFLDEYDRRVRIAQKMLDFYSSLHPLEEAGS